MHATFVRLELEAGVRCPSWQLLWARLRHGPIVFHIHPCGVNVPCIVYEVTLCTAATTEAAGREASLIVGYNSMVRNARDQSTEERLFNRPRGWCRTHTSLSLQWAAFTLEPLSRLFCKANKTLEQRVG